MNDLLTGIITILTSVIVFYFTFYEIKKYNKTGLAGKSAIIGYATFGLFMFIIGLIYISKSI